MILPDGGSAPFVRLQFPATCPTFTACGGALPGTWAYTAGCIDNAEFAGLLALAEASCGVGSTTMTNKDGGFQGYAIFTANTVTRLASGAMTLTANLGGSCGNATVCPQISAALSSYGFAGSCSLDTASMNCVCPLSRPIQTGGADTYTTTDSGFALTSSGRRFDYCVTAGSSGTNLAYHELSDGGSARDPGYFSLTK